MKYLFIILSVIGFVGCDSVRDAAGLNRRSPDEFAVVKRAPLEIPPPDYQLAFPSPGEARPQEQAASAQAKEAIFGPITKETIVSSPSAAEKALIQNTGNGDPDIRRVIATENVQEDNAQKPVIKRLLDIGSDKKSAKVVDPKAEAERIQKNKQEGKPVTEGKTPTKISE